MDENIFNDLLISVRQMGDHMHGKLVEGVKIRDIQEIEAKSVRDVIGVSQREFARILGIPVRTYKTGNNIAPVPPDQPEPFCA